MVNWTSPVSRSANLKSSYRGPLSGQLFLNQTYRLLRSTLPPLLICLMMLPILAVFLTSEESLQNQLFDD